MKFLLKLLCLLIFLSCAKQGFPPGGPEDKTPPEILWSVPEMRAVRVQVDTQVQLRFSEPVQPGRGGDNIFITPDPGENVQFHWRSRELKIGFPRTLAPDRTYVITIGTGIRDYRNNSMKTSYTLAFSTGDSLDQGEINGQVFQEEDATGIGIWAYSLTGTGDPDPRNRQPEYAVQCGKDGSFRFSYMAEARYRLFAVRDRLSDKYYQPAGDAAGIASEDVDLTQKHRNAAPLLFLMTREDTLAPRLLRVNAVHSRRLNLQFNEAVMLTDGFLSHIESADAADSTQFSCSAAFILPGDAQSVRMDIPALPANRPYRIRVSGVCDSAGQSIDTVYHRAEFTSLQDPDTTAPEILSINPARNERDVNLNPLIELLFSEPVDTVSWRQHILLTDADSIPVALKGQSLEPIRWRLSPIAALEARTVYQMTVDSLLSDCCGNTLGDTLLAFTTLNPDTLSAISGRISDANPEPGNLNLILRKTGRERADHRIMAADSGTYEFDKIFPGNYTLWGFRDRNGDGRYTHGTVFPFQPSERFFVFPDTIMARSRWNNAGNDFTLP